MIVDAAILGANKKYKSASTIVANLGSALLAGAFGRWFLLGPDHDRRGRKSAA